MNNDNDGMADTKEEIDMSDVLGEDVRNVREDVIQAIIEVKLMREGKHPIKTWQQLNKELEDENKDDVCSQNT